MSLYRCPRCNCVDGRRLSTTNQRFIRKQCRNCGKVWTFCPPPVEAEVAAVAVPVSNAKGLASQTGPVDFQPIDDDAFLTRKQRKALAVADDPHSLAEKRFADPDPPVVVSADPIPGEPLPNPYL